MPDLSHVSDLHCSSWQCRILWPTEWGQELNPYSHVYQAGLLPLSHNGNSQILLVLIADLFHTDLNFMAIFTIFILPIHEHELSFHLFVSLIFFINILYFHQWYIFFSVQYFNSLLNLFLINFMILFFMIFLWFFS